MSRQARSNLALLKPGASGDDTTAVTFTETDLTVPDRQRPSQLRQGTL